jgi:hypothetical protein
MKSITQTTIDVWESHAGELNITDATIEQMAYEASIRYVGHQPPDVVMQLARMIISDLVDAQLNDPRTLERHFRAALARKPSIVDPDAMRRAYQPVVRSAAEDAAFLRSVRGAVNTVSCKFCHKPVDALTAHAHDGGWVGDECWDERLSTTE